MANQLYPKKMVQFQSRFNEEQYNKLKKIAKKRYMTIAQVLRILVNEAEL